MQPNDILKYCLDNLPDTILFTIVNLIIHIIYWLPLMFVSYFRLKLKKIQKAIRRWRSAEQK